MLNTFFFLLKIYQQKIYRGRDVTIRSPCPLFMKFVSMEVSEIDTYCIVDSFFCNTMY